MFDNLQDKLQRVFKNLRGEGKLSEQNIQDALKEIRLALLEADVNFKVVKNFIATVREQAVGQDVLTALSPTEQVVKIVKDELVKLLGATDSKPKFASQPPTVYLIVGLQGSGKTTSTGKLAKWLGKQGKKPLLVSVDVYRPAAREQLAVGAKQVGVPIYAGEGEDRPLELAKAARREAIQAGRDVVIVDTAGRLHIDDALMEELGQLKSQLEPTEILFVADAMTGQDAVKSAAAFHEALGVTGIILTKMDGDARGGAALSIREVTGCPLKFVGTGEKPDAFEVFHPERVVSRILGMGDVLSLIEKVEEQIDEKQALEMQDKLLSNEFTLGDFRDQMLQLKKLGPIDNLLKMLPNMGPLQGIKDAQVDPKEMERVIAIISSMTQHERDHHDVINGSRRRRIAKGSGTSVQEVNQLLKQFRQTRMMMKQLTSGGMGKMGQMVAKAGGLGKKNRKNRRKGKGKKGGKGGGPSLPQLPANIDLSALLGKQ